MKIPAIRAHIGDWVYYVATMRFKDVSEYVKRVDNELHKSDLLKQNKQLQKHRQLHRNTRRTLF